MVQAADELIVVLVTCGSDEEAAAIARAAVEARWAACASVMGPVQSLYWWQGKLETSRETQLLLKTSLRLFEGLAAEIRRRHTYENPEIIALPVSAAAPLYRDWLSANLRSTG
ncbi:MAG: divalent-cation tolerance protein CutA [Terriglobales bacterium]